MPGKGNGRTKLVTYQGAIELVMALPGENAKIARKSFADLLTRYNSGDLKLIAEIEANAASDEPMHRMARVALEAPPGPGKKKRVAEDSTAGEEGTSSDEDAGQDNDGVGQQTHHITKFARNMTNDANATTSAVDALTVACTSAVALQPAVEALTAGCKGAAAFKVDMDALAESCTAAVRGCEALFNGKQKLLNQAALVEEMECLRVTRQKDENAMEAARLEKQSDEQRKVDALEAARLEKQLEHARGLSALKDQELARDKERLEMERQRAATAAAPPPAPAPAPLAADDKGLITVRSMANKHGMLDTVADAKCASVLSTAGARIAQEYRDVHGPHSNAQTMKEGIYDVAAYTKDNEETMLRILQEEVGAATARLGELTIQHLVGLLRKGFNVGEKNKILNEAEAIASTKIFERGGDRMGVYGGAQTYCREDRQLLRDALTEAVRNFEDQNKKTKSRSMNGFFSVKVSPAAAAAAAAAPAAPPPA